MRIFVQNIPHTTLVTNKKKSATNFLLLVYDIYKVQQLLYAPLLKVHLPWVAKMKIDWRKRE